MYLIFGSIGEAYNLSMAVENADRQDWFISFVQSTLARNEEI